MKTTWTFSFQNIYVCKWWVYLLCTMHHYFSLSVLVLPIKCSFIVIKYIFVSNCLSLVLEIIYNYINTRCDRQKFLTPERPAEMLHCNGADRFLISCRGQQHTLNVFKSDCNLTKRWRTMVLKLWIKRKCVAEANIHHLLCARTLLICMYQVSNNQKCVCLCLRKPFCISVNDSQVITWFSQLFYATYFIEEYCVNS